MRNSLYILVTYVLIKLLLLDFSYFSKFPEITFLDVGQGDSIELNLPGLPAILVDGGPGYTASVLFSSRSISPYCLVGAVILTHPHADHLEGLLRLSDYCHFGMVFFNRVPYSSALFDDWQSRFSDDLHICPSTYVLTSTGSHRFFNYPALVANYFLTHQTCTSSFGLNDILFLGVYQSVPMYLYGLWPPLDSSELAFLSANVNNVSVGFILDYGTFEFFSSGDTEVLSLAQINLEAFPYVDLPLDVYKLPHHGSRTGVYPPLVSRLNPRLGVISVGEFNVFGHPHPETLRLFDSLNIPVWRTDMDGTLKLRYNPD